MHVPKHSSLEQAFPATFYIENYYFCNAFFSFLNLRVGCPIGMPTKHWILVGIRVRRLAYVLQTHLSNRV